MLSFLFPLALFVSAFLLFSIQPMVAKTLLPSYGGTPAVWTVCMLFFQMILLLAYGYVWLLSRIKRFAIQRSIHTVLLLLSLLFIINVFHPIPIDRQPEWSILYTLLAQLGLPLLMLGASAPLLQGAYSHSFSKRALDPYFLYVASNLGSLIALSLYPILIERFIGLRTQFYLWSLFYGFNLGLVFIILYLVSYLPFKRTAEKPAVSWKQLFEWIFIAFLPCSLMLSCTLFITTDVAATPLFWVLPLSLYLLSFVLTFRDKPWISPNWVRNNYVFFLIFVMLSFILGVEQFQAGVLILFHLLSFFMLALLCHRTLYEKRPDVQNLSLFYFCLSLGGALAGLFNGLFARYLFNDVYEYPISLLLSLLVVPLVKKKGGLWVFLSVFSILLLSHLFPGTYSYQGILLPQWAALLAFLIIILWQQNRASLFFSMTCLFVFIFLPSLRLSGLLLQERSFYAVSRVLELNSVHVFKSQSTVHGLQDMLAKKPLNGFIAYYGPLQAVVQALEEEFSSLSVTLMGLGVGTISCQFREQDTLKAIEIDQKVIDLAQDNNLFTYLRDCPKPEIIRNDGRLAMESLADASQNLLILDAFNSDAIPVHLLTIEAFQLYKRKLRDTGVILVNLSNRHLNLLPVINAMGRSLELMTFEINHKGDKKLGQFDSKWALLTANQALIPKLAFANWRFVAEDRQLLWTDDYSNVLPLMRWPWA